MVDDWHETKLETRRMAKSVEFTLGPVLETHLEFTVGSSSGTTGKSGLVVDEFNLEVAVAI